MKISVSVEVTGEDKVGLFPYTAYRCEILVVTCGIDKPSQALSQSAKMCHDVCLCVLITSTTTFPH